MTGVERVLQHGNGLLPLNPFADVSKVFSVYKWNFESMSFGESGNLSSTAAAALSSFCTLERFQP